MAALELINTTLYNDANLVAYYQLENASHTKVGTDLTNTGSVTFDAGKFNNCAEFGANNTTKSLSTSGTPVTFAQAHTAWTMLAWVNPNASGGISNTGFIAGLQVSDGSFRLTFPLETENSSNGNITFAVFDGVSNPYNTGQALSTGTWQMLTWGYDGSNMFVYYNATNVLNQARSLNLTGSASSATGFGIGCNNEGSIGSQFSGQIDDFAVFSRALSSTEISNHFNGLDGLPAPKGGTISLMGVG